MEHAADPVLKGSAVSKKTVVKSGPTSAMAVRHANRTPARIAQGKDGTIVASDPVAGSIFIYDSGLRLQGEIKGLDKPLGVAVDPDGRIYVGCDGGDSVEVFGTDGEKLATIGLGRIQMPNDLALDAKGNLYVADSRANRVLVFSIGGKFVRGIGACGESDLSFPAALAVSGDELYVADQGNARIRVFDEEGVCLRTLGGPVGEFSDDWKGKFVRPQSLDIDENGLVHVLDAFMNRVQVLDAVTGAFIRSYGEPGKAPGRLSLPLDILITSDGRVLAADSGNHRVGVIGAEFRATATEDR
ncbi:MAG: hypothetical protein GXP54_03470 [Deltaproteobacteria bacterium]|nr:hypothetical protein [Deltaproteobacteria bacterium]